MNRDREFHRCNSGHAKVDGEKYEYISTAINGSKT